MTKKRLTFTTYGTQAEQELINKFKYDLKQLQTITEPNYIQLTYTNKQELELIKVFKVIYNFAITNKSIEKIINVLNNFITKYNMK